MADKNEVLMSLSVTLRERRPPFAHIVAISDENLTELSADLEFNGIAVRFVEGTRINSDHDFFEALADAWAFPSWCGRNWHAVDDCLADLSWLPANGYVTVIRRWNLVGKGDPRLGADILSTFRRIGEYRADPMPGGAASSNAAAFHLVAQSVI